MQLQTFEKLPTLEFMNSRTVLPLVTLTILLFALWQSQAVDSSATATLPDNEAQAKARAALYGQEAAPQPAARPAPVASTPTPAPAMAAPVTAAATAVVVTAGPQPDNEAQAKARAALYANDRTQSSPAAVTTTAMTATQAASSTPDPSWPMSANSAQSSKTTSQPNAWTAGMEAPALPITATQQQQLDQLLQQYRADSISASEYHTRRAEIIAKK
jgi:hypothetical protein